MEGAAHAACALDELRETLEFGRLTLRGRFDRLHFSFDGVTAVVQCGAQRR